MVNFPVNLGGAKIDTEMMRKAGAGGGNLEGTTSMKRRTKATKAKIRALKRGMIDCNKKTTAVDEGV